VIEPFFSIVTPCLNRATTIGAAVESVLAQAHPACEHIIIDGGSTDGTLDVLARYPHLIVHTGPDRNLYEAYNKGLRLARGRIVGLLNSDDLYAPGAFALAEAAMANSQVELVIGSAAFFTEVDGIQQPQRRLAGAAAVGLTEVNVIHNVTVMNAAFYRCSLLQRIGGFDERFPISADKDFWLRLVLAKPRHILREQDVIHYRSHAGSLTFAGDQREKLSRHLLELAATRLAECPAGGPARAAYRRWYAWTVAYRVTLLVRAGRVGEALTVARAGLALDAAWPWRAMARLPAHWRDRAARRGDLRA